MNNFVFPIISIVKVLFLDFDCGQRGGQLGRENQIWRFGIMAQDSQNVIMAQDFLNVIMSQDSQNVFREQKMTEV